MDKVHQSYSPVYEILEPKNVKPMLYTRNQVDFSDLYSEDEIDAIIERFGCLHPKFPTGVGKCQFDTIFIPSSDTVIINNRNMTNDTVEIYKDGHAISVGSWHRKDLDGNYSDIISDIKLRIEQSNQSKEDKLNSDLDTLAELGKSQIFVDKN